MEIREFRVCLKAKDFDRTCRFYGDVLGFARQRSSDDASGRIAVYQAGAGQIEILGSAREAGKDASAKYHLPDAPMTLVLEVSSAEKAYEELIFRDRNIPGGLREDGAGGLIFETRDPDGVKILLVEA